MNLNARNVFRAVVEFMVLLAAVGLMASCALSAERHLRVRVSVKTDITINSGYGVYLGKGLVAVERSVTQGARGSRAKVTSAEGHIRRGTVVSEDKKKGISYIKLDGPPGFSGLYHQRTDQVAGRYHQRKRTNRFFRLVSNTQATPTPTQRALIHAVRTHPDAPARANGTFDPVLAKEAERHSLHQARIQRQGHHNWDRRFRRINAALPDGLTAVEVCAESWPGESLAEAAAECVNSWRQSPGHWAAVSGACPVYGYDMKRGRNGIWYATGIFGQEAR